MVLWNGQPILEVIILDQAVCCSLKTHQFDLRRRAWSWQEWKLTARCRWSKIFSAEFFDFDTGLILQYCSVLLRLFFSAPLSRRSKLNNSRQIMIWLCLKKEFDLVFWLWISTEWYQKLAFYNLFFNLIIRKVKFNIWRFYPELIFDFCDVIDVNNNTSTLWNSRKNPKIDQFFKWFWKMS